MFIFSRHKARECVFTPHRFSCVIKDAGFTQDVYLPLYLSLLLLFFRILFSFELLVSMYLLLFCVLVSPSVCMSVFVFCLCLSLSLFSSFQYSSPHSLSSLLRVFPQPPRLLLLSFWYIRINKIQSTYTSAHKQTRSHLRFKTTCSHNVPHFPAVISSEDRRGTTLPCPFRASSVAASVGNRPPRQNITLRGKLIIYQIALY